MTLQDEASVRHDCSEYSINLQAFREIGKGQCGTVWTLPGTSKVLKAMNPTKLEQLWNDCLIHLRVQQAFDHVLLEFRKDISIPRFANWIDPENNMFWKGNDHLFPRHYQPTHGILSERILAVPFPVRESIFDACAPRSLRANKQAYLAHPSNIDCLVRMYLGRRAQRSNSNTFRMRNFDLMVNEMEYLDLDTGHYAVVMAQALAILHWKARVDANDVEFVLGRVPQVQQHATLEEFEAANPRDARFSTVNIDFHQRSVGMWLLDFDQCKKFQEDANGLKQLERGFFFNDPYYPRPGAKDLKDQALWQSFKQAYLHTSGCLTDSEMPKAFIEAVEKEGKRRISGNSLFQ